MGRRQKTTDRHTSADNGQQLPRPQLDALSALGSGATVTEAARRAGVDRTTLHRWLREDCAFQAAWNRLRGDLGREVEARIEQLTIDAVAAVESALANGDTRVALAVLKGVGILNGEPRLVGAEEPEELAAEARLTAREAEADRKYRELCASLRLW